MRLGRLAVVVVQHVGDLVVRRQRLHHERPGPDRRGEEGLVLVGRVVIEGMRRVDRPQVGAGERLEPGHRGVGEAHHGGQLVRGLDPGDRAPGLVVHRGVALRGHPFPGELHVGRGERLAVAPQHVGQEFEGHGREILGQQAVLHGWNLGRQVRNDRPIGQEVQQRIEHQRRGHEVLVAGPAVGSGHARSLPHQQPQLATSPALLVLGAEGGPGTGGGHRRSLGRGVLGERPRPGERRRRAHADRAGRLGEGAPGHGGGCQTCHGPPVLFRYAA